MDDTLNEDLDMCKLKDNEKIIKMLKPDEKLVLSCLLYKINRVEKRQKRTFILSTQAIYNLDNLDMKRRIPLDLIKGMTKSQTGSEFVLHIPDEYDYRFSSIENREKIVSAFTKHLKKRLKVFYKDEITLEKYTTTRIDK